MINYLIRRFLWVVPMWLLISFLTFLIMYLAPGSPATMMLGIEANQEMVRDLEEKLGLDKPFIVQYSNWLGGVLKGDLGRSILLKTRVLNEIQTRFPVTLALSVGGLLLALVIGIPTGVLAAMRPNGFTDMIIMGMAMVVLSVPSFLMGLILIFFVGVKLNLLPVGGYVPIFVSVRNWALHMVMPWIAAGLVQVALIARMTRAEVLESLHSDYVRTARAKGLSETVVVFRHAFRAAIIPVVTVTGVAIVTLLGGAFILETLFGLPGVGRLVVSSVLHRDYPVVQGSMIYITSLVLVINMLVDLLYAYLDPRIRYE